jgi:hypothetical protein
MALPVNHLRTTTLQRRVSSMIAKIGSATYDVGLAVSVRLIRNEDGVFILCLDESGTCISDLWYASDEQALAFCESRLGILRAAWIDD